MTICCIYDQSGARCLQPADNNDWYVFQVYKATKEDEALGVEAIALKVLQNEATDNNKKEKTTITLLTLPHEIFVFFNPF